jgi:ketosteroid isomerase-like protein
VRDTSPVDVALAFVARINAHDIDGLVGLMTPDHIFIDALGTTARGAERMRAAWKTYLAWFPDYAVEVTEQFSHGDIVALFGKARGTYAVEGNLRRENFWEIPAAWRALIKNGRVAEWQVYCDNDPARKVMAANPRPPEAECWSAKKKRKRRRKS